ncbi:glycoside hydrolase domain-containing protein, partial [Bizionia echini]|uniref:glycoside hydrolase domain-containing protein n=1 Tax=Bizionia echini TaxID=649333 RepID=UPI0030DB522A
TIEEFEEEDHFYIHSTTFNGKPYTHNYLSYDMIQNGGTFNFNMQNTPSQEWGSEEADLPYSLSKDFNENKN